MPDPEPMDMDDLLEASGKRGQYMTPREVKQYILSNMDTSFAGMARQADMSYAKLNVALKKPEKYGKRLAKIANATTDAEFETKAFFRARKDTE